MSLPPIQKQRSFFEVDVQFAGLFKSAPADRFRFFSDAIMPQLRELRPQLEAMYCSDNGRPAEEPSRMLAVLILQFMEGLPDRKAVEACSYDLRWKMALWMEADEPAFHATSLVKFRNRLLKHNLVAGIWGHVSTLYIEGIWGHVSTLYIEGIWGHVSTLEGIWGQGHLGSRLDIVH